MLPYLPLKNLVILKTLDLFIEFQWLCVCQLGYRSSIHLPQVIPLFSIDVAPHNDVCFVHSQIWLPTSLLLRPKPWKVGQAERTVLFSLMSCMWIDERTPLLGGGKGTAHHAHRVRCCCLRLKRQVPSALSSSPLAPWRATETGTHLHRNTHRFSLEPFVFSLLVAVGQRFFLTQVPQPYVLLGWWLQIV